MNATQYVLMILGGGGGTLLLVAAIARGLVHRHGDPAAAEKYLTWFRAERAAEQAEEARRHAALLSEAARRMRPAQQRWMEQRGITAPKELTR